MSSKLFILKPNARKPALNVIGTQVTVLASETEIQDQQIPLQSRVAHRIVVRPPIDTAFSG